MAQILYKKITKLGPEKFKVKKNSTRQFHFFINLSIKLRYKNIIHFFNSLKFRKRKRYRNTENVIGSNLQGLL